MALNKKFVGFALTIASTMLLAACGGNDTNTGSNSASSATSSEVAAGKMQDGTYTLEEKNLDENGWRVVFSITVKDGVITESNYDNVDKDGKSKLDNAGYQTAMAEKTGGVGPQQYIPELNEQLLETQNPAEIDVVTGATHSSDSFLDYAQQLVDAAKEGKTAKIEINN